MENCIFCQIASGKAKSFKIYEDSKFFACLDIRPATLGHVLVFPKEHITFLSQMKDDDIGKLFQISKEIAFALLKIGAKGVNILHSIGEAAGQRSTHLLVHVVPRYQDDKVTISWQPMEVQEDLMKKVQDALANTLASASREIKSEEEKEESKEKTSKEGKDTKVREIRENIPSYW